jgi:hypothetical protein
MDGTPFEGESIPEGLGGPWGLVLVELGTNRGPVKFDLDEFHDACLLDRWR